jgi:hypothetical protein
MSLDSITSRIVEKVNAELLQESGHFAVELVDYGSADGATYEAPTKIKSLFNFSPAHFLPNNTIMDLPRFIEVCEELIADAQDREGTVTSEMVSLIEDYPAEEFSRFGDEVVTWKLQRRQPANMSSDGKSRPQRHFTNYYKIRSPNRPNSWLDIEARPIDHVIEFQCWSKSARLANSRALWLERLFVNHSWAFTAQGCDRMYFESRGADWYTTHGGTRFYVRPLRFSMRAYEFRIKSESVIQHITFEAGSMTASELNTKGF